jgi:proline iminopeptidase
MNTAPATQKDYRLSREYLGRVRPAADAEAMRALADTPEFQAGALDVEAEYYRLHYRPTCPDPEVLDRLVPRLRANFSPDRVLLARAIEDRLYSQTWAFPGYDVLARVRDLAVPTLVLHGAQDVIPVEMAAHVADVIPGARLVVLPRCGHFAYLDDPDELVLQVRKFLTC